MRQEKYEKRLDAERGWRLVKSLQIIGQRWACSNTRIQHRWGPDSRRITFDNSQATSFCLQRWDGSIRRRKPFGWQLYRVCQREISRNSNGCTFLSLRTRNCTNKANRWVSSSWRIHGAVRPGRISPGLTTRGMQQHPGLAKVLHRRRDSRELLVHQTRCHSSSSCRSHPHRLWKGLYLCRNLKSWRLAKHRRWRSTSKKEQMAKVR